MRNATPRKFGLNEKGRICTAIFAIQNFNNQLHLVRKKVFVSCEIVALRRATIDD
jgi:hypothetical protein